MGTLRSPQIWWALLNASQCHLNYWLALSCLLTWFLVPGSFIRCTDLLSRESWAANSWHRASADLWPGSLFNLWMNLKLLKTFSSVYTPYSLLLRGWTTKLYADVEIQELFLETRAAGTLAVIQASEQTETNAELWKGGTEKLKSWFHLTSVCTVIIYFPNNSSAMADGLGLTGSQTIYPPLFPCH